MKLWEYLLIIGLISCLGISVIGAADRINDQHQKIEYLTERVQLLESALSDKSGIKK